LGSGCVVVSLIHVNTTVYLHDQSRSRAAEVHDEVTDGMLAPEAVSG
jgi:hypothetical protein